MTPKQMQFDRTASLSFAQQQWAKKAIAFRRKEDVVAWLEFQRAVQAMRETAIEVGVIKSPDAVATTAGHTNQNIYTQI